MSPLLHRGNKGIIRGVHFLDPLGGLGRDSSGGAAVMTTSRMGYTRASSTTA